MARLRQLSLLFLGSISILASLIYTNSALADDPAILPSKRLDIENYGQGAYVDVYIDNSMGSSSNPAPQTDADDYIAITSSGASIGTSGVVDGQSEATNQIAILSTDFVPQVDITATGEMLLEEYFWCGSWELAAIARGDFEVVANPSLPGTTTGELRGQMYFVANIFNDDAFIFPANYSATVANSSVSYVYNGTSGYTVSYTLRNNSGPDDIDTVFMPGLLVNDYYYTTESTQTGDIHTVDAVLDILGSFCYTSATGTISQDADISISAAYSIH